MTLQMAKCPSCGAGIQVNPESDAAVCEYCNTPFIVEKAIHNYNVAHMTAENVTYKEAKQTNKWDYKIEEERQRYELEKDPAYQRRQLIVIAGLLIFGLIFWFITFG